MSEYRIEERYNHFQGTMLFYPQEERLIKYFTMTDRNLNRTEWKDISILGFTTLEQAQNFIDSYASTKTIPSKFHEYTPKAPISLPQQLLD